MDVDQEWERSDSDVGINLQEDTESEEEKSPWHLSKTYLCNFQISVIFN